MIFTFLKKKKKIGMESNNTAFDFGNRFLFFIDLTLFYALGIMNVLPSMSDQAWNHLVRFYHAVAHV